MNIAESTSKFMLCFHVDSAMSVFDDFLFGDEHYIRFYRTEAFTDDYGHKRENKMIKNFWLMDYLSVFLIIIHQQENDLLRVFDYKVILLVICILVMELVYRKVKIIEY